VLRLIFQGDKYYRFDPDKRPPVSDGYPKPISNWEGIPNNIDDALQYSNGYTYFFKGPSHKTGFPPNKGRGRSREH
jgi:hypothetical protein